MHNVNACNGNQRNCFCVPMYGAQTAKRFPLLFEISSGLIKAELLPDNKAQRELLRYPIKNESLSHVGWPEHRCPQKMYTQMFSIRQPYQRGPHSPKWPAKEESSFSLSNWRLQLLELCKQKVLFYY